MNDLRDRRSEEKERRRNEIVQAADDLAREKGWDDVTVEGVAKRARLSRALVYLYFKDKGELHAAIWERACDALYEYFLQAVQAQHDAHQKLMVLGNAYVSFAREMPHYFEAVSRFEAKTTSEDTVQGEARAIARQQRVHQLIVDTIDLAKREGALREDVGDSNLIAVSLWAFTHGIIQIVATKGPQLDQEGIAVPALISHAFGMLEYALKKPSH